MIIYLKRGVNLDRKRGGQFAPEKGGQFAPEKWGQFGRNFQLKQKLLMKCAKHLDKPVVLFM
jgi:hypothetical protein